MKRELHRRASALLLVLWAVAILSAAVLSVVGLVTFSQDETVGRERAFRALRFAESGVELARHPDIDPSDPLLDHVSASGEGWRVRVGTEEGRLGINAALLGGQSRLVLALFLEWGVPLEDAQTAVDSLQDWITPGDLARLNGAKRDYYTALGHPDFPPGRPFSSVKEMALVRGMDAVAARKPDWQDYFTAWGDGLIDVNEASADVLEAVCGIDAPQAESVLRKRMGPDGLPHTADDQPFKTLEEFRAVAGISSDRFKNLASLLTVRGEVLRIESTGFEGQNRRTIVAILQRNVRPAKYLAWIEE